jgi:hypothetical protein
MNKEDNMSPVTEWELEQKAVAPRVTDVDVEGFIKAEHYFTAQDGVVGAASAVSRPQIEAIPRTPLDLLTICVLDLTNGFTVSGQAACADPKNFDPAIGRRLARADAKNKIWAFLGFELRSKLNLVEKSAPKSRPDMTTHVGTKVIHALPMTREDYNIFRGWPLPENENGADEGYLVEYADGGDANVDGYAGYVSWSPKAVFDRSYGAPLA